MTLARNILFGGLALVSIYACGSDSQHRAARDSAGDGGGGSDDGKSLGEAGDGASGAGTTGGAGDGGVGGGVGAGGAQAGGGESAGGAGAAGDGGVGGGGPTATMFLPDDLNNVVYRYTIAPGTDPILTKTIASNKAQAAAVRSTGELFVSEYSAAAPLSRFLSPFGTPAPNGAITGLGLHFPQEMRFIDDELWVLNSADHACTTEPQDLVRVAFDAQGTPSAVGTVQTGLIGANRAMLWNPETRDLYVSQCYPVDTIQHFQVASDHTVTALAPIAGNGLDNPHGMVMTSWGELLVANVGHPSGSTTLLRFSLDSQGNATANGSIMGNGVNSPVGLAFAPWGELFVVNEGDASISRFTFDASHAAVPNGNFKLGVSVQVTQWGVAWLAIVPGDSGG